MMLKVLLMSIKKYNKYCDFKNNKCSRVRSSGGENCCNGCLHLIKNICTIDCIHCKIWYCEKVYSTLPRYGKFKIQLAYTMAEKLQILKYRNK